MNPPKRSTARSSAKATPKKTARTGGKEVAKTSQNRVPIRPNQKEAASAPIEDYYAGLRKPDVIASCREEINQTSTMPSSRNSSNSPIIGIDFGTTKTMVAEYDPAKRLAKVCRLGRAGNEMPTSMISTEDGELLFGDDAHDEPNPIRRFKMMLGKSRKVQFGQRLSSPVDLTADFLSHLKTRLESEVCHRPVEDVVLTVPAIFGPAQRRDLQKAAKLAGFKNVELLHEPSAAGKAYCDQNTDRSKSVRFLVVDWGGGTLDLAVVERNGTDDCKVLLDYFDGSTDVGGEDIDDELWIAVSDMLQKGGNQPLESQPEHEMGKYRRELTRAKEALSVKNQVTAHFTLNGGKLETIFLDRNQLEEIIDGVVTKGVGLVAKLLQRCKKGGCQLDFVLLVGGTTKMPVIRHALEKALQIDCRVWSEGRDAIALGAAIRANELWGSDSTLIEEPQPDLPADGAAEIIQTLLCPHCGDEIEVTGTGNWNCDSCGNDFVVSCNCPECSQELEIEQWGIYSCPIWTCRTDFDTFECALASVPRTQPDHVERETESNYTVLCPHCEDQIEGVTGTGDWSCPWCKKIFEVGCDCPKCGESLEVPQWGVYPCPTKKCNAKIDTRKNATFTIPAASQAILPANCLSLELLPSSVGLQVMAILPEAHPEMGEAEIFQSSHYFTFYTLRVTNLLSRPIKSLNLTMEATGGNSHSIVIPAIQPGPRGALSLTSLTLQEWFIEPGDLITAEADGIAPVQLKVSKSMCNSIDNGKALKEGFPCMIVIRKASFSSNYVMRIKNVTDKPLVISGFDSPAGPLKSKTTTIEPGAWVEIGWMELTEGRNFVSGEKFRITFTQGKRVFRHVEGIIAEGKIKGGGAAWAALAGLGALAAALAGA